MIIIVATVIIIVFAKIYSAENWSFVNKYLPNSEFPLIFAENELLIFNLHTYGPIFLLWNLSIPLPIGHV